MYRTKHMNDNPDMIMLSVYNLVLILSIIIIYHFLKLIDDDECRHQEKYRKIKEQQQEQKLSLENRMRSYEDEHKNYVSKFDTYVVRIDGSNFKAVSHKFPISKTNVFDKYFVSAMATTAKDLISRFHCQTIYVHSDEISLVFKAVRTDNDSNSDKYEHIFGGQIEKIISEIPAYASVRFCHNLKQVLKSETNNVEYKKVFDMLNDPQIMFDGRLFTVPEDYEVSNYLLWRSCQDCYRNCVSGYAQQFASKISINNMKTKDRLEMLYEKFNVNINQIPQHLMYGIYMKKHTDNGIVAFSIKIKCTDDVTDLILSKKITDEDITNLEQNTDLLFKQLVIADTVILQDD